MIACVWLFTLVIWLYGCGIINGWYTFMNVEWLVGSPVSYVGLNSGLILPILPVKQKAVVSISLLFSQYNSEALIVMGLL